MSIYKKPNIIFVLSDQQRWDTIGTYGQALPISPYLDRMAEKGTCFEHAYSCIPVCGPARACLMTGRYPNHTGCFRNGIGLRPDEKTLPRYLKEGGGKKYVETFLYDLKNDPNELKNLITNPQYDAKKQEMKKKMEKNMLKAGEEKPEIIANRLICKTRYIKKCCGIFLLLTLISMLTNAAYHARLDVSGKGVKLAPATTPQGGVNKNPSWRKNRKEYELYSQRYVPDNKKWYQYNMSFVPKQNGEVRIMLLGPYIKKKGQLVPVWVKWKDLNVTGAVPAGANWDIDKSMREVENGSENLKVCYVCPATRYYKVIAGQEVKISAKVSGSECPAFPIDLKSVVNMGFCDEKAGDGKGGWSDQGGPRRDMRDFDYTRTKFGPMDFSITNPQSNGGKSIITFDCNYALTGKKICSLKVPQNAESCRYLYLLHTSCWNSKPQGTVIGNIEITYVDSRKRVIPVKAQNDVADWANCINCSNAQGINFKKSADNIDKTLFISKFDLGNGNKRSITLSSNGKVVWIVVGASLSDRRVKLTNRICKFTANNKFKAVDMNDLVVKPGSALDFSYLVENGPAGKHGRSISRNGILAFTDKPDQPVRFLITCNNLSSLTNETKKEVRHKKIRDHIKQVKIQGYNLIRYWIDILPMLGSKKDFEFNPQSLDDMDYFLAEAKANGIYAFIDLASYGLYHKNPWRTVFRKRNTVKALMTVGDPEVRHWWESGVRKIMTHVNPYTKTAWKDEKSIVFVDFYNEQEMGQLFVLCSNLYKLGKKTRKILVQKWRIFLKERYGSVNELAKAWKKPELSEKSFSEMPLPGLPLVQVYRRSTIDNDYWLFMMYLQRENMKWYDSIVKSTGYDGLCSSMNIIGNYKDGAVRSEFAELVIGNQYFAHPSSFSSNGSRCRQESSITTYATLLRTLCIARLWDRPMIVTEWNHAFWNPFQHEAGLLNPAYFSLQNFYGAQAHSRSVVSKNLKKPMSSFSIGFSPIGRTNEVLTSCLFMRKDVKVSPHRVKLLIDRKYLDTDCNAARSVHSDQSKIALVCGFGLDYQGWPKASGAIINPKADMAMTPVEGATAAATGWTSYTVEKKSEKARISAIFRTMREKGILDKNNISDPTKGIFQSDTGEITLHCKERRLEVKTPRTEGATINPGKQVKLGTLAILACDEPATVALCSVDGKDLVDSRRMLLIFSTFAVNTDMELSDNMLVLRKLGKYPVLMKTASLKLQLKKVQGTYKLYALGFDGSRREELPVAKSANGLDISINTAELKNGPTTFFELEKQ